MPRGWVLWDGDCGLCSRWAHWIQSQDTQRRFHVVPYQDAPSPPMYSGLEDRCAKAVQVVTLEGREIGAGRAVLYLLQALKKPGPWGLASRPPLVWMVEFVYGLVALNRRHLQFLAPKKRP